MENSRGGRQDPKIVKTIYIKQSLIYKLEEKAKENGFKSINDYLTSIIEKL